MYVCVRELWASIGKSNLLEIVFKFRRHQRRMKNNNSNHYWCPHTMCKVFAFKSIIKWWNILDFPDFVSLLFSFWFSVMSCHVMLCLCCVARISLSKPFSHFISNWWTDTNLFHCAQPDANAILMIGNRILIENSDAFAYKLGCAFRIYAQTNTSEWQNIRWLSHFADEKNTANVADILARIHLRRVELQAN